MAIIFACPGCGKKFKVEDGMAGRKGKCPGCDTTFQIPGIAAPTPRTEVPAKTAPSRGRVDDDEDRPARPEGRRRPRDDEDDDRPRRRPTDEEDFDEEEVERPRRRRKKKQKSVTGLILGIVAGALTLLAAAGVGAWLLTRSGGPAGIADDLRYLPDHSEAFLTFNFEALTGSELYKRLRAETTLLNTADQQTTQDLALAMEDLQRVTMGGSFAAGSFVVVFRCKKPVALNDLVARSSRKYNQEATFGGHRVRHDGQIIVCVPEPHTIVMGSYVVTSRALERKGTRAKLSPSLQPAFDGLDLSKVAAAAVDLSRFADGEQPARDRGGLPLRAVAGLKSMPETVTGTVDLGETVTLTLTGTCKSSEAAEDLKKQLEAGLAAFKGPIPLPGVPREVMEIAKKVQLSTAGNRLTANLGVEIGLIIEAAKKAPGGPGKPPVGPP